MFYFIFSNFGKTYFSPQHPHWIWETAGPLSSVMGAVSLGHVADSLYSSSVEIIVVISQLPAYLHGVF
jgi:hypothetical protein